MRTLQPDFAEARKAWLPGREAEEGRRGLRDVERRLEKREDLLDQKLDLINKKGAVPGS